MSKLEEVARRVAEELTRESPSYNQVHGAGTGRKYQYAPHLVALGDELLKVLEEDGYERK